jgi:uncharacterized protein (DUF4415 family)
MAREGAARMTDEEDAEITAAALSDPDNPPWEGVEFRPVAEVRPELIRRWRGQRGPQKSKPVKTQVSLRLDPDVIAHFKKHGPGWQSRINAALRRVARLPEKARYDKKRVKRAR